jgi:alanine-glyoxylate transaminase / serine-glyoxylate transaminase / serine-pyruvate transaminase
MATDMPPLNPPKRLLLGPGPSMVAPRVYEAMGKSIVGYLDPYCFQVIEEIQAGLRKVFGTTNEFTIPISGTGSAGMEAAVANFAEPNQTLAIFVNGFFSERISEMARRQGARLVRFEKPWGEIFGDIEAREFIQRENPSVVAYVQAETSTGAFQPGKAICEAAHEAGAVVIADCVTSLGGLPVEVDATGIDIAYSCSQKCLSCPPGISPFTVSPRAWERLEKRATPVQSWYLDLKLLDGYYKGHKYHHTVPISMLYALHEGLALIEEEGLEKRWERHRRNHLALVAGLEKMGLEMHVAAGHRLWTLNTPRVPTGVDDAKVRKRLLNEYCIEILGGFGPLAGKVFRIGLMGSSSTEENVALLVEAVRKALSAEQTQSAKS